MAYLGNTPAARFTSMDKQTITGDGGTGYTLDHAVGSEQEIEVFVNNVRQEPSVAYTVVGTALTMTGNVASTDDFYVVFQGKAQQSVTHPSSSALQATTGTFSGNVDVGGSLLVDTIKEGTGTNTAITIDSSGQVSMPNTVEIDAWRLTSNFTTDGATITGWERTDDATFAYAGTGMSESSGVFTFPKTGLYKVTPQVEIITSNSDTVVTVDVDVSADSGSTYDRRGYLNMRGTASDPNGGGAMTRNILVNVTNASTFRFRLVTGSLGSGSNIAGNTDYDRTSIMFERITDSQ
jgi:hypothetical protein